VEYAHLLQRAATNSEVASPCPQFVLD
jgi:hypothetical protein